jgi:hypothetical protein
MKRNATVLSVMLIVVALIVSFSLALTKSSAQPTNVATSDTPFKLN